MAFNLGVALGAGVNNAIDTKGKLARQAIDDIQAQKLGKEFAQEGEYEESFKRNSALGQSNAGEVFDQGIDYGNAEQNTAVRSAMLKLKPEEQQALLKAYKGSEVDQSVRSAIPAGAGAASGAAPFVARTDPNVVPTVDFYGKPVAEAPSVPAGPIAQTEAPVTAAAPAQRQGIDLDNVKISGGATRSHEQITAGVMEDMARAGNMAGWTKAAAINKLAREVTAGKATDDIMNASRDVQKEWKEGIEKNGVAATVDAFRERLSVEGINVKNVIGKDGKAGVAILGADGQTERVLTNPGDITKEFLGAHETYVMGQLRTAVPGLSAKDYVGMMKDGAQASYYADKIKLDKAMQPYEIAAKQASTNASNASAKNSTDANSRAAALHPGALTAQTNASNASVAQTTAYELGKVKGSFTAEDGQIINEMDNGKFRFAGNGKVIDPDQFATMKLTPMPTRNGSVAQTHENSATGQKLWTRNDSEGFTDINGKKVDVPDGMAITNAQARPRSYPATQTKWDAAYAAYDKDNRYMHNGTPAQRQKAEQMLSDDRDRFFRQQGQPAPSLVEAMNSDSGRLPPGTFITEQVNGKSVKKDVSGQTIPLAQREEFFKKHPTARSRAIQ